MMKFSPSFILQDFIKLLLIIFLRKNKNIRRETIAKINWKPRTIVARKTHVILQARVGKLMFVNIKRNFSFLLLCRLYKNLMAELLEEFSQKYSLKIAWRLSRELQFKLKAIWKIFCVQFIFFNNSELRKCFFKSRKILYHLLTILVMTAMSCCYPINQAIYLKNDYKFTSHDSSFKSQVRKTISQNFLYFSRSQALDFSTFKFQRTKIFSLFPNLNSRRQIIKPPTTSPSEIILKNCAIVNFLFCWLHFLPCARTKINANKYLKLSGWRVGWDAIPCVEHRKGDERSYWDVRENHLACVCISIHRTWPYLIVIPLYVLYTAFLSS